MSWELLERSRALLVAVHKILPPGRIFALRTGLPHCVVDLIARVQAAGANRTDLPGDRAGSDEFRVGRRSVSEIT